MKQDNKEPIKVAIYGMDDRTRKTMVMCLQKPCKGFAVVVDETDAEVDIIDADHITAREILDSRQSITPERPIILLSLEDLFVPGTIYLKKPIDTPELISALNQANALLPKQQPEPAEPPDDKEPSPPVAEKKQDDKYEKKKISKHRTAKDITEINFSTYIGHIEGINFSDQKQVLSASYNPKKFFLGYVQSACKVAKSKGKNLQLNSGWKSLTILLDSNEIWLDANDKQLRSFAGLIIRKQTGQAMSLSSVEKNLSVLNDKMENFYDMDAFLWKLTVWTSKGRYPNSIDINKPVFLKQWPNFTRLIITPHAMRIAALLIIEPRTLINLSESLDVKPQYVFVFISAAYSLGLIGQVKRKSDQLIAPTEINKPSSKKLLSRILSKLRGIGINK